MKRFVLIITALTCLLTCLILTACDNKDTDQAEEQPLYSVGEWFSDDILAEYNLQGLDKPEGEYTIYAYDNSSLFLNPIDIETALKFDKNVYITLYNNGCEIYKPLASTDTLNSRCSEIEAYYKEPELSYDEDNAMFEIKRIYKHENKIFEIYIRWFEKPSYWFDNMLYITLQDATISYIGSLSENNLAR